MKKATIAIIALGMIFAPLRFSLNAEAAGLDKGMVTFTVDDNESSMYDSMYPILGSYNFPATAYVVTDWVGTAGHVNWQQLKTLQYRGWEIGSHTQSHKDLTKLSLAEMKDQLVSSQIAFRTNGIHSPKTFASPYGEFNNQVLSVLKSLGFTSNRWAWSEFGSFNEPASFDPFNITVVSLKNPMTFNDAKTLIDEASAQKKWLVFVNHKLVSGQAGDYEFNTSDFQRIASYLQTLKNSGKINVKTVSQGVRTMQLAKSSSAQSQSSDQSTSSSSSSVSNVSNSSSTSSSMFSQSISIFK